MVMITHHEITGRIMGTDIVEYTFSLVTAQRIGLECWGWTGNETSVRLYTFGGIIGGWSHVEIADFHTLAEFADCANEVAERIWQDLRYEWEDRVCGA